MTHRIRTVALHRFDVSHRTQWRNVELVTSEGLVGTGECSDLRPGEAAEEILDEIVGVIAGHTIGDDLMDLDGRMTAHLEATQDPAVRFRRRLLIGAVMTALCDIEAQVAGAPLSEWLGGATRPTVELYANINRAPVERRPDEFARTAAAAVAAGFQRIKLAPFDGPALAGTDLLATGITHLEAVREAIGYETAVLVDVHHRLTPDQLLPAVRAMEELGVGWIEDAVDAREPARLEALASMTDIPLAGGETLTDPEDVAALCAGGWLDYLLLDPKYIGGALHFRAMLASVTDVTLTLHDPTGPISTAASAHLTSLSPDSGPLEYAFGEAFDRDGLVTPGERLEGDLLVVPTGPGIGLRLSPDRDPATGDTRTWNP